MSKSLLGVFAHPDDETFLAGPILAKYAAENVHVELICGTPPQGLSLNDRSSLQRLSLKCAAEIIGIQRVHFLGYCDSPMYPVINPDFGMLTTAPLDAITENIRQILEQVRPSVIITDSPYGSYGHPDHVVIHNATVAAFTQYSRPDARLYCLAFPSFLVKLNMFLMRVLGRPVKKMGPLGNINLAATIRKFPGKTALIDVGQYVVHRRQAAHCYATEIKTAAFPLRLLELAPLWVHQLLFKRAAFTRLSPTPEGFERNLFEEI
ncbi:MAG: PIG-L family deacetylase [Chloroflexota bacterium]|nr:PIG-L family deacetylase [Chloroflexota bacterium]